MIDAGSTIDVKSEGAMRAESTGGSVDIKASGVMRQQSGGAMSMKAGGNIGMDGTNIYLNSGNSQSADGAEDMEISIPPPKNPNAGGPR